MKKRFTLILTFLLLMLCTYAQKASRLISINNALQYAKSYCNDSEGKYDYYKGVSKKTINGRSYYYIFVDQQPGAGWEHACKHLYICTSAVSENFMVLSEDGTHPYGNIDIEPLEVKDRYGSNSTLKAKVAKLNSNDEKKNKFVGNTYAVILSGGMNKIANDVRYWNDCSFIYQTLRNRYGIPKKNIKVIMADGTDPAADMTDENGEYSSSPLDLDDDGVADIEYSATKTNVTKVIKEMASTMKDEDHLFLYVVDHGGYDPQKKQSYICLWGDERIYPDELSDCLNTGDAGYVTVLMGQCYSGGFVNALKGNNRIIATACGEDELSYGCEDLPFDEFVYRWTSALNGYDAFGNKASVTTDTLPDGTLKPVTMVKAYEYARSQDMYTDGKFKYGEETPQISYLLKSTAEDLAMDTIPPTVYLCISSGNTKIAHLPFSRFDTFAAYDFWDNSDIWLRNQDDGLEVHEHETPKITDTHRTVYIYTRISNRGVKTYPGYGTNLRTWWAKSSYVIDQEGWKHYRDTARVGGEVCDDSVDEIIAPGGSCIKDFKYTFTGNRLKVAKKPNFNMCLLSFLSNDDEDSSFPVNGGGIAKAWATDRLGQKNRYTLFAHEKNFAELYLYPLEAKLSELSVVVRKDSTDENDNDIEVKLTVPMIKNSALSLKGFNTNRFRPQDYCVKENFAMIDGISVQRNNPPLVSFSASVIADRDITKEQRHNVDVFVVNNETNEIIGGEKFVVIVEPRAKITPNIDKTASADGTVSLKPSNINEEVEYEWYDKDGNLVSTEPELKVSQLTSAGDYTLKVIAKSDKATNSVKTTVEKIPFVKDATMTRPGIIDADFNVPAQSGMTVRMTSATGSAPISEVKLVEGATHATFNVPSSSSGVLQLSVMKNGKPVDDCKILSK